MTIQIFVKIYFKVSILGEYNSSSLLLFKYFFLLGLNHFLVNFSRNIDINNIFYTDITRLKLK